MTASLMSCDQFVRTEIEELVRKRLLQPKSSILLKLCTGDARMTEENRFRTELQDRFVQSTFGGDFWGRLVGGGGLRKLAPDESELEIFLKEMRFITREALVDIEGVNFRRASQFMTVDQAQAYFFSRWDASLMVSLLYEDIASIVRRSSPQLQHLLPPIPTGYWGRTPWAETSSEKLWHLRDHAGCVHSLEVGGIGSGMVTHLLMAIRGLQGSFRSFDRCYGFFREEGVLSIRDFDSYRSSVQKAGCTGEAWIMDYAWGGPAGVRRDEYCLSFKAGEFQNLERVRSMSGWGDQEGDELPPFREQWEQLSPP